MANKNVKKSFRFTESEWQQVEKKCELANITPTQYFQQIALTGKTAKQDCIKEKQIYLGEIAMISNGISLIARKLNCSDKFDSLMLQTLFKIEKHMNKEWLL